MSAALRLRSATLGHPGHPVLVGVDLELGASRLAVVRGPSGGGKTTLLLSALGLLAPLGGTVTRAGGSVALVPQADALDPRHPASVSETVLAGGARHGDLLGRPTARVRRRAEELLTALDLAGAARRRVDRLSGGQRQRVLVARAFVGDAELVAMDEPVSALDADAARRVVDVARAAVARGATVLFATHQVDLVRAHATDLVEVADGRVRVRAVAR